MWNLDYEKKNRFLTIVIAEFEWRQNEIKYCFLIIDFPFHGFDKVFPRNISTLR